MLGRGKSLPAAMLTVCLGCTSALAQDRQSLSGFRDFHFGASPGELEQAATMEGQPRDETIDGGIAGIRLEASDLVELDGAEYSISFFMMDDKLFRVNLTRAEQSSDASCTSTFNRLHALVRTNYGEADRPPDRKIVSGIAALTTAGFTFRDGSAIQLATVHLAEKCTISIAFSGSRGDTRL